MSANKIHPNKTESGCLSTDISTRRLPDASCDVFVSDDDISFSADQTSYAVHKEGCGVRGRKVKLRAREILYRDTNTRGMQI